MHTFTQSYTLAHTCAQADRSLYTPIYAFICINIITDTHILTCAHCMCPDTHGHTMYTHTHMHQSHQTCAYTLLQTQQAVCHSSKCSSHSVNILFHLLGIFSHSETSQKLILFSRLSANNTFSTKGELFLLIKCVRTVFLKCFGSALCGRIRCSLPGEDGAALWSP